MSDKVEKRFNVQHDIRAEGEARSIKGYAAVFNSTARINDRFQEKIAPGAFAESIAKNDIRALWSHNPDYVIGRNKNGSLKLREDDHGLGFDLAMPDTSWGRDAHTLISGGFVTGVSFGFRVKKESWTKGENGTPHTRTLELVDLIEISPTAFPAYEQTHVASRSSEEILKEIETEWAFQEKEGNRPTIASLRARVNHLLRHVKIHEIF